MQQVELAATQHLPSTYSSPRFSGKFVYNYGLWGEQTAVFETANINRESKKVCKNTAESIGR
jgi:hypothetical protein